MQAEQHKSSKFEAASASDEVVKTSRRGGSSRRCVAAGTTGKKDTVKTSYSNRRRTSDRTRLENENKNGRSLSMMRPPPAPVVNVPSQMPMSQFSALTDVSTMNSSQMRNTSRNHFSQGTQSQRSSRSHQSQARSVAYVPLGQPSQSSALSQAETTGSLGYSHFSQQSNGVFGTNLSFAAPSSASQQSVLGMPLTRRVDKPTSNHSVAFASPPASSAQRTHEPLSEQTQRLAKTLIAPQRRMLPPQTFRAAAAAPFGSTALPQSSTLSQSGQVTNAPMIAEQQAQEEEKIKSVVLKEFKKLAADMESKTLAKVEEKVSSGLESMEDKMESGTHALDSKLKSVGKKMTEFAKAVRVADRAHDGRLRLYSEKSQELDGKLAEVVSVITTERESTIKSIKEVYNTAATKLHDVATDISNSLHNLPVPEMLKSLWAEFRKVKGSHPTAAHKVESTPKVPGSQDGRRTPSSSSVKTTQTKMTYSSKKSSRTSSTKCSQSKRDSRSILSPLQIVQNPSRKTLKRRSDVLDSPASKVSVVTPTNLSRSFKRPKSTSSSSAMHAVTNKRGRTKKSRSSAFSSKKALADDYGFLS